MTPSQHFQKQHGAKWAVIANSPELTGALMAVNAPLLDEIVTMSAAQIASPSGNVYLARLQGQLLHERALIDLSIIHPEMESDMPLATYPNPEDELEKQADQQDTATGGEERILHEWMAESSPVEPPQYKPKQRRKTRVKKIKISNIEV